MNKITLIGNLTKDPEIRATSSGVTVCSFTIAVNRKFGDKDGEKKTDYFRIIAWRQLGETCNRYLAKGRKIAVVGELQASMYESKDGTTRMSLDVQADEVEFLTPKGDQQAAQSAAAEPSAAAPQQKDTAGSMAGFTDISSDDIPF